MKKNIMRFCDVEITGDERKKRMSKCTTCPFIRIAWNWTVKDQEYVEKVVKLSGVSYSEFMTWLSTVIRRAKVE